MNKEDWASACSAAIRRPLQDATNAWGAVVSAAFVVCAAAGGFMFMRWWRLDSQDRHRIWKHYGWFTGLICIGSCMGAASNVAWSQWLVYYHQTDYDPGDLQRGQSGSIMRVARATHSYSRALRWLAVYAVSYPFTLGCLVITKLLVIDRLMDFSKLKGDNSSRLELFGKTLVCMIVVGNVAGLSANIAAAVFFARAAQSYEAISLNVSIESELVYRTDAQQMITDGSHAAAIHIGFETIMLIIIVFTNTVVGVKCALRIRAALSAIQSSQDLSLSRLNSSSAYDAQQFAAVNSEAVAAGQHLKRQIIASCSVVFVSFLLRASYTTMATLFQAASNINAPCEPYINRCNPSCYNIFSHMLVWNLFTPEFYFAIVFFSQPLTLLAALWGMTSGQAKQILMAKS